MSLTSLFLSPFSINQEFKKTLPTTSSQAAGGKSRHRDSGHAEITNLDDIDEEMDMLDGDEDGNALEMEVEMEDIKPSVSNVSKRARASRASSRRSGTLPPPLRTIQSPGRRNKSRASSAASTSSKPKQMNSSAPPRAKRAKSEASSIRYTTATLLSSLEIDETVLHILERTGTFTLGRIPNVKSVTDWLYKIAHMRGATSKSFLEEPDAEWSSEESNLFFHLTNAGTIIEEALAGMS